jgi:toxin ParE1/3/4
MKLEWLPAAMADRDTIYDYIKADSRRAAIHVDDLIEQQVDRLIDHPHRGRAGRLPQTRELVILGAPYIVVYQVGADHVLILRVFHAAQSRIEQPDAD